MRNTDRSTRDHQAPARARPLVVSTRVRPNERALIGALAEAEQASVCEVVYRALIPAVRARLREILEGADIESDSREDSQ